MRKPGKKSRSGNNIRKIILWMLPLCFLLGACAAPSEEESIESNSSQAETSQPETSEDRTEESEVSEGPTTCTVDWKIDLSKVPENWTRPKIMRLALEWDVWNGSGEYREMSLAERLAPPIQHVLEEYWRSIRPGQMTYDMKKQEYTITSLISSEEEEKTAERTPEVIRDPDTWVLQVSAPCRVSGFVFVDGKPALQTEPEVPPYEEWKDGQEYLWVPREHYVQVENWDMEGRADWIIRQKDQFLDVMSYADYVYARITLGGEKDPFEEDWAGENTFQGEYVYLTVTGEPPSISYYFAPLHGYVYEGSTIYRYEASTAAVSEAVLEEAVLAMGNEYMQGLCSENYQDHREEIYKIWDYRGLTATIVNRMDRSGEYEEGEVIEISDPKNVSRQWNRYKGVAMSDQIWIVSYDVGEVRVDGGGYGAYGPVTRDEWFHPVIDPFPDYQAAVIKDGSIYYLIFMEDIAPRTVLPAE